MSELVRDGVNGLTFEHRKSASLARTMLRVVEEPQILNQLSQRGYLYSDDGQVPSIETHVDQLLELYSNLTGLEQTTIQPLAAPRRITFDTNPDDCNFSCVMCEQHSEFSPHQKVRKEAKIRRRRMDFDLMKQVIAEAAPLGLEEIVSRSSFWQNFPMRSFLNGFSDPVDDGRTADVSRSKRSNIRRHHSVVSRFQSQTEFDDEWLVLFAARTFR